MAKAKNEMTADTASLRLDRDAARQPPRTRTRASRSGDDSLDGVALAPDQFLRQLQLEKRRSDRTKSPLSFVLVQVEPGRGSGVATLTELLDLLLSHKRETDFVGHVDGERIGFLLPHTDAQGVRAFIGSFMKRAAQPGISISSATYPDHLLDNLMSSTSETSASLAFLFSGGVELGWPAAILKRCMDIVGALVAIVLFSPIMLLTAIAIVATSPGPIVFRQQRLGKGGVPFVFYKFRSMRTNADDRIHREYVASLIEGKHDEINQGDAKKPLYKMTADPRIFPVGRVIRKTSIDELPQLFNVLKGDMSLVGPRPPLPYEAEKYQSWHLRRVLDIRPGITGLWQVDGRSTTSFDEMVRLDLRYIRDCSFWLDVRILFKTVMVVLRRDGAG